MMIMTMGLDPGKNWIHMVGFDGKGRIVLRRRERREGLLARTVNLPPCLIGWKPALAPITWDASWRCRATSCG